MVNAMTSQAATPCGMGKFGSIPLQQAPRPADTTVACVRPTHIAMLALGTSLGPLCVSSLEIAPSPVPLIITVWPPCADWTGVLADMVPSPATLKAPAVVNIPNAEDTTVMGKVAVVPPLFSVTVAAPRGVLDGRIASTS